MTLTNSSRRLTRWILRLLESDFTIVHLPGRFHQVLDALSRLLFVRNDTKPVDDEIPYFENVLVTTRSTTRTPTTTPPVETPAAQVEPTPPTPDDSDSEDEFDSKLPVTNDVSYDEELDDVFDEHVTIFDFAAVYEDDGTEVRPADVPLPITRSELLESQRFDDFCQTVLAIQSETKDSRFFEDENGVLRRTNPHDEESPQVVVPSTLRSRLLSIAHNSKLAGHSGQKRMYYTLRGMYYWPHMAADIFNTVRNCHGSVKNRIRLRKKTNPLALFLATVPLRSLAIDILGPLTKTKRGFRFLLVITDRSMKLTQVIPLRNITAFNVAVAFVEHWVFKYGPGNALSRIMESSLHRNSSSAFADISD